MEHPTEALEAECGFPLRGRPGQQFLTSLAKQYHADRTKLRQALRAEGDQHPLSRLIPGSHWWRIKANLRTATWRSALVDRFIDAYPGMRSGMKELWEPMMDPSRPSGVRGRRELRILSSLRQPSPTGRRPDGSVEGDLFVAGEVCLGAEKRFKNRVEDAALLIGSYSSASQRLRFAIRKSLRTAHETIRNEFDAIVASDLQLNICQESDAVLTDPADPDVDTRNPTTVQPPIKPLWALPNSDALTVSGTTVTAMEAGH